MAAISPDNFDPLRHYVDVRLQMGVPLVDRDWNELADMRRFELRTLLKWFVGNGVPSGSNAFLIEGNGAVDDFVIHANASPPSPALLAGLPDQRSKNIAIALGAGRCLVDGLEVLIEQDILFSQQPLHKSQPGSAALAASLQVPQVSMPAPANGTATAYLDVWEHAVVPNDDPDHIILPGLGVESCARVKREWAVRVRMGTGVPAPGESTYLAGHSYYALATIARRAGGGKVNPDDVTDLRQTRLTLADLEQRLHMLEQLVVVPAFAPSPNQFNPKFGAPLPATSVTLFGKNFDLGPVTVLFGTTPANLDGTPGSNQLKVFVPTMPAGPVKITVQTAGGPTVSVDTFTVLAPPAPTFAASPNQFNPKFGPATTNVTLFGSNFNVGTVAVRFGNTTASLVGTPTAAQIIAAVPAMPTGPVKVTVQTGGGSVTSNDSFTVT